MARRLTLLPLLVLTIITLAVSGCSHKTTISRSDCLNSHGIIVVNSQGQDACAAPGTPDDGKIVNG